MKIAYISPEVDLQERLLQELLCESADGSIEDFKDGGEFVW